MMMHGLANPKFCRHLFQRVLLEEGKEKKKNSWKTGNITDEVQ